MSYRVVGTSSIRTDAADKVTGAALFPGDRDYPNALWMKVLFAGRPHARIVKVDTSRAELVPGVTAVLTAKDVPVNEYGLQTPDQPVLCGPGSTKPGADIVRFVGDQVAVMVAETEEIAAQALGLIEVVYEDLPLLIDPLEARQTGAFPIHAHRPDNIAFHQDVVKGDVSDAWAHCDVVVEETYYTPAQEHIYMQPEAGSAYIDDQDRVTVHVAGQWAWEDQQQIAHALGIPSDQVRVVYDAIGGAFGGREDMSVQIILGLAVQRLRSIGVNRPVKIVWSRRESILGHCKRHPMIIYAKWGATSEGKLVACDVEIVSDAGAYMYTSNKVMSNALLTCIGPYACPNVHVRGYAVYTNNLPGGAFRGFGAPQGAFAAESQMDRLAEILNMSPVEIRRINLLDDDATLASGTPIPGGVSLQDVLEKTAEAGGWRNQVKREDAGRQPNSTLRCGRGIALGFKNIGFSLGYQENSWAKAELVGDREIEAARLYFAGAEVGQGHHTAMAQIAAEVLSLPMECIAIIGADTSVTESSGSASASRLTFMAGNAVRGACERAKAMWDNEERPAVAEYTYLAPKTEPFPKHLGQSFKPNFAYGYVAQSVEIVVDVETGKIDITRLISTHDVGKAINPQQVVGQVEGGVVQAQGYAMLEDFKTKDGQVLTADMSTYLIPGILDIPQRMDTIILEHPDPNGPFGVRGMAEMPLLPLAPALAAALRDATGVWFNSFPLTPERVLKGLGRLTAVED
jgi:CO/xanthine dehydrogenase Mo-binding subunit